MRENEQNKQIKNNMNKKLKELLVWTQKKQVVEKLFRKIEWKQPIKIVRVAFFQDTMVTTILLETW